MLVKFGWFDDQELHYYAWRLGIKVVIQQLMHGYVELEGNNLKCDVWECDVWVEFGSPVETDLNCE